MLKASFIAGISLTVTLACAEGIAVLPVSAQVLYDGSRNTPFSAQNWLAYPPPVPESVSGGGTTLNTTASNSLRVGYAISRPLNRISGYTLSFDLRLLTESHASLNRAGFSIIALGNDKRGIELGFWKSDPTVRDRIWAQNDGTTRTIPFTRAESTTFDPSRSIVRYNLSVKGNQYSLFTNGNQILSGNLRDYSRVGPPLYYNRQNFVFLGDNTESAQASVRITRVALSNTALPFANSTNRSARLAATSVPEPMTIVGSGMAIALGGLFARKRPSKDKKQG
ncbi:PEP-CTERM sorting domain-containing protein [Leptolyngbya sp. NIES-2104]|uniref:PEP-CTERM sorting domain-containing protein n=1 Tax=Leptolyngbya sp. NIES-2104 TaxID=1552121 RepID=UPI0006EC51A9|nr:PEP-CTERM sorting domain-containing protein [Leptolyngbya sp. NIES-2104]GAP96493.1 hemolysin-type calcium binding protein [Leptolyngbya sp. NIES-2104]